MCADVSFAFGPFSSIKTICSRCGILLARRSGRVFSSGSSFTLFARKSASCLSLARISKLLSARLALTDPWMTSSFTFYSWIALPVRRGYKDSIPSKAFHCKMEHSRALASGRALISKSGLGLGGVFLFSLFQFLFSIF